MASSPRFSFCPESRRESSRLGAATAPPMLPPKVAAPQTMRGAPALEVSASSSTLASWPSSSTLCPSSPMTFPMTSPFYRMRLPGGEAEADCDCCSTVAPTEFDRCTSIGDEAGEELPELLEEVCEDDCVFDVVADEEGKMMLVPVDSADSAAALRPGDLPSDSVVTIRVFRFFEAKSDEKCQWERELRNVNSGSLMWLIVHMLPKMHSVSGCKYGQYFTIHHIRVRASSFASGYYMAEEGACPLAKGFGATPATRRLVSGESLATGYFWFVSPDGGASADVAGEECLQQQGWQHVSRHGPWDGKAFLKEWKAKGGSTDEACVSRVLQAFVS